MAIQYSIQKMVSDGTLSTIALGIQYLQRNDIYIRIAGEETPQVGAPSGYTWSFINNTTLKILPVVPNGVEVVVYRRTDVDAMYNVYSQNAQFDEVTIDENNQQLLYIAQEYLEQGIPGAGVDTIEFLRDDGINTYYRIKRTDGSYSEEFAVPSASNSTKVLTRESIRRSYAEAGYNLVSGSFEAGGTLVNANDVLLQERTGKAFTGPAGTVAAGTNPASGGFVDVSNSNGFNCVFVSSFLSQYPTSTTGAINAAIAYAQSTQRKLVFPRDIELTINSVGSYGDGYNKGIHFPTHNPYDQTKRFLVDFNGCKFKAGDNNLIVIKISGSYGKYEGQYSVLPNGKSGVVGTALAPEKITADIVPVAAWGGNPSTTIWNDVCKSFTEGCDVGHLFAVGGDASNGLNSACYYNTIHGPVHKDCRIPMRFYGGYATGLGLVNRNRIIGGGAIDYNSVKKTEVGVSIEGGDTNRFTGYDFEGLAKAVKLVDMPGGNSIYNVFQSCMVEDCAIDMEMDSPENSVIACGFNSAKVFVGGALGLPRTFIAADPFQPQSFMGLQSTDSINMRLKAGATLGDTGKPNKIATNVQPAAADLANVTDVHADSRYGWRVLNGICTFHVKLLFTGVTLTTPIRIALPEVPNAILYTETGNIHPAMFPVVVRTSADFVVVGTFSDESDGLLNGKKFLKIAPPTGNWSSGQFNKLNFEISYQIA